MLCEHCRGSGAESPADIDTCSVCKGRGVVEVHQQMAPGFVMRQEVTYALPVMGAMRVHGCTNVYPNANARSAIHAAATNAVAAASW